MSEQELIQEYRRLRAEFNTIQTQAERHFFGLAKIALENGDVETVKELISACPDTVTCVFIIDALQQWERQNA